MRFDSVFVLAVIFICIAPESFAQSSSIIEAQKWLNARIARSSSPGYDWAKVQESMQTVLNSEDQDGAGLTKESYERNTVRRKAISRSQFIAQRLRHDLNNDGDISQDEVVISELPSANELGPSPDRQRLIPPTPELRQMRLKKLVAEIMRNDIDGNGVITFEELRAQAEAFAVRFDAHARAKQIIPQGIDANGDGVITVTEWDVLVFAEFQKIDTDGNGQLSSSELEAAKR